MIVTPNYDMFETKTSLIFGDYLESGVFVIYGDSKKVR